MTRIHFTVQNFACYTCDVCVHVHFHMYVKNSIVTSNSYYLCKCKRLHWKHALLRNSYVRMRKIGCLIIRDKPAGNYFDLFSHGIMDLKQNRKAHSQFNSVLLPVSPSLRCFIALSQNSFEKLLDSNSTKSLNIVLLLTYKETNTYKVEERIPSTRRIWLDLSHKYSLAYVRVDLASMKLHLSHTVIYGLKGGHTQTYTHVYAHIHMNAISINQVQRVK